MCLDNWLDFAQVILLVLLSVPCHATSPSLEVLTSLCYFELLQLHDFVTLFALTFTFTGGTVQFSRVHNALRHNRISVSCIDPRITSCLWVSYNASFSISDKELRLLYICKHSGWLQTKQIVFAFPPLGYTLHLDPPDHSYDYESTYNSAAFRHNTQPWPTQRR